MFSLYSFYMGNVAANVATNVIILLVPIPLVWKLQMRPIQKVLICGIFMLGGLYILLPTRLSLVVPGKQNIG